MAKKKRKGWVEEPEELLLFGTDSQLIDIDPESTPGFKGDKDLAEEMLERDGADLAGLQEQLFAESRAGSNRAVLMVLQGMDTAGKGGIVRHVLGLVDPQGVHIASFKKPTEEELSHDFLWRIEKEIPAAGMIGVFDRSHYEDVLIQRVRSLAQAEEIERRYAAINEFELKLHEQGVTVLKVMLHISKAEQGERLLERLERSDKYWKYNPGDVDERMLWDQYQRAYQIALERTSTPHAPWFVVPADQKWYARLAVQQLLLDALEGLDLEWPDADFDIEHEKQRLAESNS